MSVCVLSIATPSDGWGTMAADAASAAGSAVQSVVVRDAEAADAGIMLIDALVPEMRVVLAEADVPLALIGAAFGSAPGAAARKIVDIAADGVASLRLFDIADMLIFTPAAIRGALGLGAVPETVEAVRAVQALLTRPNQAAVVRFPRHGAAALWADRTMFVALPGAIDSDGSDARFSGTIAAAVAQGIGPERALEMALHAANAVAAPR